MASIRKLKTGYRAEVARNGNRKSKVFPTKQEAKDWAARAEYEILNHDKVAAKLTLGEVFERYAREVSPSKRGHRWEAIRLEKIGRDAIAKIRLEDLSAKDFSKWRDARLKEVAPASVIREMQLMSSVLTVARRDWELIGVNPLSDVRKPTKPQPRDRLPAKSEIEAMQISAGQDLSKATARAFHAFKFAMESAMRAGEIAGLEWERVDLDRRVALLTHTKNGRPREVPLSTRAVELLRELPDLEPVFGLSSRQLDVLFRKLRDRAGVTGLTFHDSRHAAITALSTKLDGWLVDQDIAPHIPVIDKSGRSDGTFERADVTFDAENDAYICPGGKELKQYRRAFTKPREPKPDKDGILRYRARKSDCDTCLLKSRCCPKEPQRKVTRSIYEPSRDVARAIAQTTRYAISCKLRKKVEMLFAHLKRILGLGRLRLRGPCGARDEFHLAATAQNLRKLAKLLPLPQKPRPA